tara:strand:- start:101 stop:322 length:222 start_codon:yes stop_codon:yes gene_type:complete
LELLVLPDHGIAVVAVAEQDSHLELEDLVDMVVEEMGGVMELDMLELLTVVVAAVVLLMLTVTAVDLVDLDLF